MADPPKLEPDLDACLRVLEAIAGDHSLLAEVTPELRKRLLIAAGQVSRPVRHDKKRLAKVFRRRDRRARQHHDAELLAATELRSSQRAPLFLPPPRADAPDPAEAGPELAEPRSCYVCKHEFRRLHFFYDSMCPPCAELNYAKRFQTASLDGRVALITGARVKIGYQAALKLLRAGARVVVTTRFPHDSALRYAREADWADWQDRLQIHGLDLRHAPSVEHFAHYLERTLGRLDIIINNAAQTVRRPSGFYTHLLEVEARELNALPPGAQTLLHAHDQLRHGLDAARVLGPTAAGAGLVAWHGGGAAVGLTSSAALSQLPVTHEDVTHDPADFPTGHVDGDRQQIDLRQINSWRLGAADVPTPELLEVHLVNAVAPFILVSKLKPLMLRHPNRDKHIVNVSAMEAQFSRNKKTDKHPHTNMAKAALNMLTRTSASDYAADGIFMNSVDTGWVTDEDPLIDVARKQYVHDFHPPLDVVDGAARVCDPLFAGLLSGHHGFGQFLKDYRPTGW